MDDNLQYNSFGDFLQQQESLVTSLYENYQRIISGLSGLLKELPPELLILADTIECSEVEGMSHDEVIAFANGLRYAATVVGQAVAAKMITESAEMAGEFNTESLDKD